ncbi:hypothetical protein AeRB84_006202 [Aphanomyces euteiches]|nr:hypothetical protein AeRB84_006202 [Aphanomyces euteiches]
MRYGLKLRCVHGEAASVNPEDIERGREDLRRATQGYPAWNICNMDETAYFYSAESRRTVSAQPFPGRKIVKKRITVALTSNADGSCKPPLLFIGKARQPRCFGSVEPSDLDYTNSKKGWMTQNIFSCWVEKFNEEMASHNRKVLLLLDNVSSHRYTGELSHVKIVMLPPNTTPYLQPQDAGIIRMFKSKVEELKGKLNVAKFDSFVESLDVGDIENAHARASKLHEMTVLEAMEIANGAWKSLKSSAIANCWRHTEILGEEMYELVDAADDANVWYL